MGRDIDTTQFTPEDRTRYRDKVKADLVALRQLVDERRFQAGDPLMGLEMELYLTDEHGAANPVNAELLARLPAGEMQSELARFNGEIDLPPRRLEGSALADVERQLRSRLTNVASEADQVGASVVAIGILPTLTEADLAESNMSGDPRYRALNDAILAARGEDVRVRIQGDERLVATSRSILFEAACTSLQLHLQVGPDDFARYWNAAQALAAPLVAVAANSPFFLGRALHHETRIALFEQAIDTRTEELAAQGVRPRVWFGESWLSEGVFELFDENVRYFPALLPLCDPEDPLAVLATGGTPELPELCLHNGTIYRWNRPVYSVAEGVPRIRIENRVLPAGPTVVDGVANAALYYGLVRALADGDPPVWRRMSFEAARDNFFEAARAGLGAQLYWPGIGARIPVDELLVRHLLPLAQAGLRAWGIDGADIDRLLHIIERRAVTGRNGAAWQRSAHHRLVEGQGLSRPAADVELVRRYRKQALTAEPVHTWEP